MTKVKFGVKFIIEADTLRDQIQTIGMIATYIEMLCGHCDLEVEK